MVIVILYPIGGYSLCESGAILMFTPRSTVIGALVAYRGSYTVVCVICKFTPRSMPYDLIGANRGYVCEICAH